MQAAFAFSQFTGVRISVKNKGHDYKGRSSGKNTLALWVSPFYYACTVMKLTVCIRLPKTTGLRSVRAVFRLSSSLIDAF